MNDSLIIDEVKSNSKDSKNNSKTKKNSIKTKTPRNKSIKQCNIQQRPCITDVYNKVTEISNIIYELPKTSNKGKPGNYLEELTGIPTSSECLDCTDGEVKAFPVKKLKNGKFSPKETIAVTMLNKENLINDEFINSKVYKKLSNVLYVPYFREDNMITYMSPTIINLDDNINIKEQIKEDYDNIRDFVNKNKSLEGSSSIGVYLQNRTKGAGGNNPKTRAFYLKTKFIQENININS